MDKAPIGTQTQAYQWTMLATPITESAKTVVYNNLNSTTLIAKAYGVLGRLNKILENLHHTEYKPKIKDSSKRGHYQQNYNNFSIF